jgi:hypothetical protein
VGYFLLTLFTRMGVEGVIESVAENILSVIR